MGYHVNYDALERISSGINNQAGAWTDRLSQLQNSMQALVNSGTIQGAGADQIKSYLTNVHGTIISRLQSLISLHASNFLLYKSDYQQEVDADLHAVIDESLLQNIKKALEKSRTEAININNEAEYELRQIRDIFPVNFRDVSGVDSAHSTVVNKLTELDDAIKGLEQSHSAKAFDSTAQMIDALNSFIAGMAGTNRYYKSTFSVRQMVQSGAFSDVFRASVAVQGELTEKATTIEAAQQQEALRKKALEEEAAAEYRYHWSDVGDLIQHWGPGSGQKLLNILFYGVEDVYKQGSYEQELTINGKKVASFLAKYEYLIGDMKMEYNTPFSFFSGDKDGFKADKSGNLIEIGPSGTFTLARGTVRNEWFGLIKSETVFSVLDHEFHPFRVSAQWMNDGKFEPGLFIGGGAEGAVLKQESELRIGTDAFGFKPIDFTGEICHVEADAGVGVGVFTDENGKKQVGAQAKAGAMAAVAKGTVKGGFELFGIKFYGKASGLAVAAGAEAKVQVTPSGVSCHSSKAAMWGYSLDLDIDWSGFDAGQIVKVKDDLEQTWTTATEYVGQLYENGVSWAKEAVDYGAEIWDSTKNNVLDMLDYGAEVYNSAIDSLQSFSNDAIDSLQSYGSGLLDWLRNPFGG